MLSTPKKVREKFVLKELMLLAIIMEHFSMELFLTHLLKKEDHLNFKLGLAKLSEDGMKEFANLKREVKQLLHALQNMHMEKEEQEV